MTTKLCPLSPIDLIFTGNNAYPIEFAFVFANKLKTDVIFNSLKIALREFYPLRGTLALDSYGWPCFDDTIDCTVTRELDRPHLDLSQIATEDFYPLLESAESLPGKPLLKVTVVHTAKHDALLVSASHAAVDGFSYFMFLTNWARVVRSETIFAAVHSREKLRVSAFEKNSRIDENFFRAAAGIHYTTKREAVSKSDLCWQTQTFSSAQKQEMMSSIPKDFPLPLSFNDVLSAQLWRSLVPNWGTHSANEKCFVSCPVDLRRMLPQTPANYFGNAVCVATAEATFDELEKLPLFELAGRVRSAIRAINVDFAARACAALENMFANAGLEAFESLHAAHPKSGLLVTNLSRLPSSELDFGAGVPVRTEILTPATRGAIVLAAADGVQVKVCSTRI